MHDRADKGRGGSAPFAAACRARVTSRPARSIPFAVRATNPSDISADAVALPAAPALVAGVAEAAWLSPDGEIALLSLAEAARRARDTPPFLCHARATARRLGVHVFPAFDLLELYAFVRPAHFCLPTPRGLAGALGPPLPPSRVAGP